jgi:hypothetical protein
MVHNGYTILYCSSTVTDKDASDCGDKDASDCGDMCYIYLFTFITSLGIFT